MSKQKTVSPQQTKLPQVAKNNTPQVTQIKDSKSPKNQGIILISQQAMQDIYEKSGPLANSCEFQTHYWFLNLRYRAEDNSILDIAIPTVYFNYTQKVSGARIDFEMKDVAEISAKVLPIHNMKVAEILKAPFIKNLEYYFGITFEKMSVDVGSIHKHPGSSKHQSFSVTDLCTIPADHGVVYPFGTCDNDKPNFAGIMALDSKVCNVAHYEYRTANGTLGTDISYVKGRCLAIMLNDKADNRSIVEKFFKDEPEEKFKIKENNSIVDSNSIQCLVRLFKELSFKPFTDTVSPTNLVETKVLYQGTFDWGPFKSKNKTTTKPSHKKPTAFDPSRLSTINTDILLTHLKELDMFYYEKIDEEDYKDLTKREVIDNILEMYILITEEENEVLESINYELDKMKEDLISYGVAPSVLVTASEEQIRKWHANV